MMRKATALGIAKEAPSATREAEAAAIRKAAPVAVGEAAPVSYTRARRPVAVAVGVRIHVAHPGVFDAVQGDGIMVAVAGAGALVAHGRGEDVALRVDAAAVAGQGWQG